MISCLMVCVNYGDMLRLTLPFNQQMVHNMVVVTVPEDKETLAVCQEFGIKTLEYRCCFCPYDKEIVKDETKMFHLSKMINQGLMYIYENFPDNWCLYLNSDVILNPNMKILDIDKLSPEYIYGVNRYLIPTKKDFDKISKDGKIDFGTLDEHFEDKEGDGIVALGFFQLFKKKVFYDQQYLEGTKVVNYDASHSDILFVNKFVGKKKLKNYHALHLGMPGVNWGGRVSDRWEIK